MVASFLVEPDSYSEWTAFCVRVDAGKCMRDIFVYGLQMSVLKFAALRPSHKIISYVSSRLFSTDRASKIEDVNTAVCSLA